jgi:hypothetical protein
LNLLVLGVEGEGLLDKRFLKCCELMVKMIVTITIRLSSVFSGDAAWGKQEGGIWGGGQTETEDLLDDSMEAKDTWKNLRILCLIKDVELH